MKTSTSILGYKNYFFTYSAWQTLVPPNLCLHFRLFRIGNVLNVLFPSCLNRLNTLIKSLSKLFVDIGNVQNLGSHLI